MKKSIYIQPETVCFQVLCEQHLMKGSDTKAEVFSEDFDPDDMKSLSRKQNLWDDEDDNTEE